MKRIPVGTKVVASMSTPFGRVVVWLLVVFWTIPTLGLFVSSWRPEKEIKTTGWWTFFANPSVTIANYQDVLAARSAGGQMGTYFWNSVEIAIPSTIIPITIAALAAYAFSWMTFRGRDWIFTIVVGLMIVPLQMALIPLLRLFTSGAHIGSVTIFPDLNLNNSVVTVWIAHTCFGLPLAVFLLRNFISSLPRDLIEAARVDGASHLRIFVSVVMPLSVPAFASLGIFQFLWTWNDYLVGYVFAGGKNGPMTVKLVELAGNRGNEWQRLTAAAFVTMVIPLLVFASLQRYFVRGLIAGAVKG